MTIVTKSLLDPAEPRSMKGKYIQVRKDILVAIVTKSLLESNHFKEHEKSHSNKITKDTVEEKLEEKKQ